MDDADGVEATMRLNPVNSVAPEELVISQGSKPVGRTAFAREGR